MFSFPFHGRSLHVTHYYIPSRHVVSCFHPHPLQAPPHEFHPFRKRLYLINTSFRPSHFLHLILPSSLPFPSVPPLLSVSSPIWSSLGRPPCHPPLTSLPSRQVNGQQIVNAQYNSPLNLYSEDNIAETLSAQAEVLGKGCLG